MGDKWTLLIIRDLAAGPRRFVELQRVLPGISTEQLRSRLNRMVADGLLTRQRYREVPPRVDYELTERSRELMPVVGALARWGYEWAWSAPREGEEVNLGAVFRLAPGLLDGYAGPEGTIEIRVDEEPDRSYVITLAGGRATISEQPPTGESDARVRASLESWIRALGPEADLDGLAITGSRRLADTVLAAFTPGTRRAAAVA